MAVEMFRGPDHIASRKGIAVICWERGLDSAFIGKQGELHFYPSRRPTAINGAIAAIHYGRSSAFNFSM